MILENAKLVTSNFSLVSLEDFAEEEVLNRFQEFKNFGVIKSLSNYEDMSWKLTDEYSNVGLYEPVKKTL